MTSGIEPPPAALANDVAQVRDKLGKAEKFELSGDVEQALALASQALADCEPLKQSYPPIRAEALVQVASAHDGWQTKEARGKAEPLYDEAFDIANKAGHAQLIAVIWRRRVQLALRMDSTTTTAKDHLDKLQAAIAKLGDCACARAKLHHLQGELDHRDSNYPAAVSRGKDAIDAFGEATCESSELRRYYHARAKSEALQGEIEDALDDCERALKLIEAASPCPEVIELQMNSGLVLNSEGESDRARTLLETARGGLEAARREESLNAGVLYTLLSDVAYQQGNPDEALEHGEKALAIYDSIKAPDHRIAEAHTSIGNAEFKRENLEGALARYKEALALRQKCLGSDHFQLGVNHGSIAETLAVSPGGDKAEAQDHLAEAKRILKLAVPGNQAVQQWIDAVEKKLAA
jgi:tetratricopeptide (TPR) repeat protein